jgi:hypothetical protein
MKLPAARTAPFAAPDTPALCLLLVSTTRFVLPSLFSGTPPGPRHRRRRPLPPTSPWTATLPSLISLDQSP